MTQSSPNGLLSGLRVVEAATMVMVPSVGALLADYGAEVVKIEPLEGDLNRRGHHIPGMPIHPTDYEYAFLPDNRGKRSLALDLKAPEAHASCAAWSKAPTSSSPTTAIARSSVSASPGPSSRRSIRAWSTRTAPASATTATRPTSRASTRSATGRARRWRRRCFRWRAGWGRSATAPAIIRAAWRCSRACCSRCSPASAPARETGCRARWSRPAPGRTRC